MAFFNQHAEDVMAGRVAVRAAYGAAAMKRIQRRMKSGAMEIFQHPQTPEALCYVMTVATSSERRYSLIGAKSMQFTAPTAVR